MGEFFMAPKRAVTDKRLTDFDLRVMGAIESHMNKEGVAWPGRRRLQEMLDCGDRSINPSIARLLDAGYYEIVPVPGKISEIRRLWDKGDGSIPRNTPSSIPRNTQGYSCNAEKPSSTIDELDKSNETEESEHKEIEKKTLAYFDKHLGTQIPDATATRRLRNIIKTMKKEEISRSIQMYVKHKTGIRSLMDWTSWGQPSSWAAWKEKPESGNGQHPKPSRESQTPTYEELKKSGQLG